MKHTHTTILAAVVLMGLTIFASCKKENETKAPEARNQQCASIIHPEQIDDMNAYLKDFKLKMQTSKGEESVSIDEAAWHLSSLANYDFANANVEFDAIRFDTVYANVEITNGTIQLSDLASVYAEISTSIDKLYHSFDLANKHFRFIDSEISEQGIVSVAIITTFSSNDKWHFFQNDDFCDIYFSDDINYYANSNAIEALTVAINSIVGKNLDPNVGRVYYVVTRPEILFNYRDWLEDPNEYCPNAMHSRLYNSTGAFNSILPKYVMCYYLDSYLGLAVDNVTPSGPEVINCAVLWGYGRGQLEGQCGFHDLKVNYGQGISGDENQY